MYFDAIRMGIDVKDWTAAGVAKLPNPEKRKYVCCSVYADDSISVSPSRHATVTKIVEGQRVDHRARTDLT